MTRIGATFSRIAFGAVVVFLYQGLAGAQDCAEILEPIVLTCE
jgi:hypothetical protein